MKKHLLQTSLLLICSVAALAVANDQNNTEQWDRSSAMAAIGSANIDAAMDSIGDIASLADGKTTLSRLRDLETRTDLPLPAREAAIYYFTRSLTNLPRDAVSTEVMGHLQGYQARTLVPHEEHAVAYIPLFNIRGAAAGVENGWQRTAFTEEAINLLEESPGTLVSAYAQSTDHIQRSGYLDALKYANIAEVMAVQDIALQQFQELPELTPVIAATSVITTDIFAIQQLLLNGQGAELSVALVQLNEQLQPSISADLLAYAIQSAPASSASLAIAAWWPRLKHDPATRDLMIGTLADPDLGAAAALALAQNPDIQTINELQNTASGDSVAAHRAQMALDFNRAGLIGGSQP